MSSIIADIDDLAFVKQAMQEVTTNCYSIGLHWGIDPTVLDQIKMDNRRDVEARFTSIIAEWLKNPPRYREQ